MYNARQENLPKTPKSVEELGEMLEKYKFDHSYIYRGTFKADDGSTHVIFGHKEMINLLKTAKKLYVDGTFAVIL